MRIAEINSERASPKNGGKSFQKHTHKDFMSLAKHTFLIMSNQKRVGKSTVIMLLAQALSKKGMQVGLLDLNYHNPNIHILAGCNLKTAEHSGKRVLPMPCSGNLKVASIKSVIKNRHDASTGKDEVKISDVQQFIFNVDWGALDYLLVDTPSGPEHKLIPVLKEFAGAETIIVTSPIWISMERSGQMLDFYDKLEMPILGWIENMQGFLCQTNDQYEPLFETGPPSRAIFLQELFFLGQIPIDPYLEKSGDAIEHFLNQCPDSQAAEACDMIVEKIINTLSGIFVEDRAEYEDYFR